ncbi:unnamed protein product, partial [Ascophyllum nodosum]
YDDYEHVASLLNGTCTFNTFMCCWTRNDGDGMEDNTDVCRYVDPTGVSIDFPGESEGETHCHGFGWPEGSEYVNHILPLYFFVRNFDHSQYRGYYGNVQGAPECGCIETMPVVSRADCTTFSSDGLTACQNNDLSSHYKNRLGAPGGDLDFNLVGTCDN